MHASLKKKYNQLSLLYARYSKYDKTIFLREFFSYNVKLKKNTNFKKNILHFIFLWLCFATLLSSGFSSAW